MALKKTLKLKNNFDEDSLFVDAYIKVSYVNANKDKMDANVIIYKEKDGNVLSTRTYATTVDLTGDNFIAQAYKYLKTLPEFSGAQDC